MKRRAYLSLVAVALAGCGGDGGGSTPTDGGPATAAQSATATPTPTDTSTPTPEPAPEDPLEALEWHMTNAVEAFPPEGETFGSVTVAVSGNVDAARGHLDQANSVRSELSEAGLSGDRQSRFEDLTGTYHFLDRTVKAHQDLRTAWEAAVNAHEAVITRDESPNPYRRTMNDARDDARSDLNTLQNESDASNMAAFSALLPSDYDNKVSQLDSDITALGDLAGEFGTMNSAMQDASRGFQFYDSESYNSALVAFTSAKDGFEAAASEFAGGWPDHFATLTDSAACVCSAMASGCQRMAEVSESANDGNVSDPAAAKDQARGRFEECAIVFEDVTIVQDFYGE